MKGQIKIFETIAVLVVFFFLIAFGLNFYFLMQKTSLEQEVRAIQDRRAVDVAQRITFLPELDCNFIGVVTENCFDRLKLQAMAGLLKTPEGQQAFFPILGYANITLQQIYPAGSRILLYEKVKKNGREIMFRTPVLLFDPVTRSRDFAVLEVRVYA